MRHGTHWAWGIQAGGANGNGSGGRESSHEAIWLRGASDRLVLIFLAPKPFEKRENKRCGVRRFARTDGDEFVELTRKGAEMPTKDGQPEESGLSLKRGLGRRSFLRGAGITAASGAVLEGVELIAKESSKRANSVGPGRVPMVLNVNGKEYRVALEPRTTLADALRYDLGLTGTKVVCDRGACSACTVWLDKTPVNSCMTLAVDVGKRRVTTIEGLASGDHLHPVQAAFINHYALQCGFCTPGMIMSCAALLERKPDPDINDVKLATSGNLCRCGTYPKVFDATLEAAEMHRTSGVGGKQRV